MLTYSLYLGMGVEEDLSSVEVYNPYTREWTYLSCDMKEVNGWCSAALGRYTLTLLATIIFWTPDINIVILFLFLFLVDKPVRMMLEKLNYHKQEGKFVS